MNEQFVDKKVLGIEIKSAVKRLYGLIEQMPAGGEQAIARNYLDQLFLWVLKGLT